MLRKIITGFHAVEERVLKAKQNKSDSQKIEIFYSKIGPRVKKIISIAKESEIPCTLVSELELNQMVKDLPLQSQDHRGIVLSLLTKESESSINLVDFNQWILENSSEKSKKTVVILDSITDPHNAGAIIRSCDQFAVDLVIFPERRGVKDIEQNEVIARTSAGSVAWVPISIVSNLVRTVQILKENGFWVYAADAGGSPLNKIDFAEKKAVIMGSEGSGLSKLLQEQCDYTVSIPTSGKIDSLNVSVASGILLYEIYRRTL